jgi:hypothetical protein
MPVVGTGAPIYNSLESVTGKQQIVQLTFTLTSAKYRKPEDRNK